MQPKQQDPTGALVAVVNALEPLNDTDRQWVLQSAASRWGTTITRPAPSEHLLGSSNGPALLSVGAPAPDVESAIAKKDARAFIRLKRPSTDVQRIACLGYFLVRTTGNQGFSSKDIGKSHTESGGSSINMTRALDNATRGAKFLSNRGPKEKQLTTLGEDVVLALPDQEAVKNIESAAKGRGKARTKKKSKKKS